MNDDKFLDQIREQLDASEQQLDASILSRLNQSRQKALAQKKSRQFSLWLPAAVTASLIAVFVAGNILLQPTLDENLAPQFAYDDIELLISDADIDLLLDMELLEAVADDAS